MAPAVRDAQLNTRASVRTLAESASPISISARLFVGLAVLARLAIKSVRAGRRINCSVYRLSSLSSGSGRALAQPTGRRPEHRRLQRWPSSSRAEAKRHTGHHIVVCARRLSALCVGILGLVTHTASTQETQRKKKYRCSCRKLTLGYIGGAVRPKLARPTSDRQSGRHGG
jgi:hypothetical protein